MRENSSLGEVHEERSILRRGREVYRSNPSLLKVATSINQGPRLMENVRGEQFTIVREEGGEVIEEGAVFAKKEFVDKTQFIKLYSGAVRAITGLSGTGARVFAVLYQMMLERPNTDEFYLNKDEVSRYDPMSQPTFYRGTEELLDAHIIFKSVIPGKYFINIDFVYNGNRFIKITDYRCRELEHNPALPEHTGAEIMEAS